ncbi:isocitrate lyase/phosphoenolpyruvate mutase family protein [Photobacterium sp. MCCC 1A19761]|uniref:isocitrate lyase/PEP mutase family protein n=1 Tax=Photobacterium sp. MCCC 1A19761 TaxID=3115000 RepID=UPI00307D52AE
MHTFTQLHQLSNPLLLGNVWDATSARCAEQTGYQALGTSSAAMASLLGYDDGEQMPFQELVFMVQRIATATALPLSVDIEAGYSQVPEVIANHIQQLAELGVVGINLEDSRVETSRNLCDADEFASLLFKVREILQQRQVNVFINVRCDAFLLGVDEARAETIKRARLYQASGADGLFVPCITQVDDIKAVAEAIRLPLNVMAMPDLPSFEVLAQLGVKRISTGNFAFEQMYTHLGQQLAAIKQHGSCATLFS